MTDKHRRVWDLIEKVGIGMLTTCFEGGLRARPLEARPDRARGLIWFVTDAHSHKVEEIAEIHEIGLVFIDPQSRAYLSITGRGIVERDPVQAAKIWKKTDDVWWPDGPNDADARVLRVEPITAELWDGPASAAVAAFEFAKATLTGEEPKLGENRKVTMKL